MPAPSPTAAVRSPPPLRLHHLLIWTALAALLLAAAGLPREFSDDRPRTLQAVELTWRAVMVVLYSAAIGLTGLGITWRRRGWAYFDEPGHWLLAAIALSGGARLAREALYRPWWGDGQSAPLALASGVAMVVFLFELVTLFSLLALCIFAARQPWRVRPWKWEFYWKGAMVAMTSATFKIWQHLPWIFVVSSYRSTTYVQPILFGLGPAVALVVLAWAVHADRRSGGHRHWTHTAGVVLQFASHLLYLGMYSVWV